MKLAGQAERTIDQAIKDVCAGKFQRAVDALCRLRGHLTTPRVEKVRKVEVVQRPVPAPPPPATVNARQFAGPLPKPHRRHRMVDRVAEFRALYTRCCIIGCDETDADPHHWWPRGLGSPDEHALMSPLGRRHHEEAEHLGREAFCAKYASRMPPIDLLKARLAGMMQEQAKLGTREAVDLDADIGDARADGVKQWT